VLQKPDVTVIADKQICTTDASVSAKLNNAVAGNSYNFELININSGSTIQNKTATPGSNGTFVLNFNPVPDGYYRIKVTNNKNGTACDDASSSFTIHPKQNVSISSSELDKEVCEGTSITLSAKLSDTGNSSGVTYKWYKLPNTTNVIHYGKNLGNLDAPNESGDYKVVISQNGCSSESTITGIKINPKANISASDASFCKGNISVNVNNFHNGLSYKYELFRNDGTTLIDSKTINNSANNPVNLNFGANTGNLKIKVTVNGVSNCDSFDNVFVYDKIVASVTRNTNDVCEGSNIYLTATFTPNYPSGYSRKYTWYDSANNVVQTGSWNKLKRNKYNQTDSYYVKVEIDGCDAVSSPIDVNIKPKAKFTINNDELCGGSVTYTNYDNFKVKNADIIAGLDYKYELIDPSGNITDLGTFNNGTVPSFTISPSDPTKNNKYKLRVSVDGACPITKSFWVNKEPTVIINAGSYYPRCEGDGSYHRLKAIVSSTSGVAKYEWEKDGSPYGGNNRRIYPNLESESGTYTVKVTLNNGCEITSNPITIKINPNPEFESFDEVICQGSSVNLFPKNLTPVDPGTYTYSWTGPGGPYNNVSNISVNSPGTYTLTIRNIDGCDVTHDFIVDEEYVEITPTGFICSNNGVATLTANVHGQNPHNYRWTLNGNAIGGDSSTLSI
ncbi:MAG: hypothetical protein KAH32_08625, partial [Chlamydiia bacterium]|nr:hypothetical protein [Chlamydiia bacterium]